MASEQRKIERVIPKIGIVTRLRKSTDSNPFFPRRQELRFKAEGSDVGRNWRVPLKQKAPIEDKRAEPKSSADAERHGNGGRPTPRCREQVRLILILEKEVCEQE